MDLHQLKDLIKTEYSASEDDSAMRKRLLDVIDQMVMLQLYGWMKLLGRMKDSRMTGLK